MQLVIEQNYLSNKIKMKMISLPSPKINNFELENFQKT